jgi:hypothetical protein
MFVAGESHAKSGGSRSEAHGSGCQRQRRKPPQPELDRPIGDLARASTAHALAHPLPGWHPFDGAAWRPNGCDHRLNRARGRPGGEQRRAGITRMCDRRDKEGWSCVFQDLRRRWVYEFLTSEPRVVPHIVDTQDSKQVHSWKKMCCLSRSVPACKQDPTPPEPIFVLW